MSTAIEAIGEINLELMLEHLACPACHSSLSLSLHCDGCGRTYQRLPESAAPCLLPDDNLAYKVTSAARALKTHVQERFAMIDRALPGSQAAFATFLNLGYLPNESPRSAVRGPRQPAFNRNSTMLLFEVLGAADLDGKVVFDLGTGRGGNVAMISRYYSPRVVVGLDLSPANVEFCCRHHASSNVGFAVADVEFLPIRSNQVEVVFNLESSHYYPNLPRFFEEVYRVLASGGEFLYADILPAETFRMAQECFDRLGLELLRDQDISANVLLSCEAIGKLRETPRYAKLYETFLVVPGRPEFAELESGVTQYRILRLRKP
jgi:ubiquinone/menaquinone biosynthesis C-methylase UbiE